MHPIQYITYVQYMCTEPMVVRPYTSGLYTAVLQWLLGVQYYCTGMVFGLSPSECVGWYKWTPANTAVHNLVFIECQLVPNIVLCALGHV